jgi:hypothetical protein
MGLEEIEMRIGVRVAGLIGYNFLKNYVVTLDYPQGRLLLEQRAVSRRSAAKR